MKYTILDYTFNYLFSQLLLYVLFTYYLLLWVTIIVHFNYNRLHINIIDGKVNIINYQKISVFNDNWKNKHRFISLFVGMYSDKSVKEDRPFYR